jgi:hypothetical protein
LRWRLRRQRERQPKVTEGAVGIASGAAVSE